MEVHQSILDLRSSIKKLRHSGKPVGFLATMGYLHEGHLSLLRALQDGGYSTVVSIFVNPTQFNDVKDFEKYPSDIPRDCSLLEENGADIVFTPSVMDIYGHDKASQSNVDLLRITQPLEGVHRPGHFRGVSTVVSILFNCVQPDATIFGEKDFQQLRLIEEMVADLKFPIEVLRGKLLRDPDGLAMSSRNVRLSSDERSQALSLSRGLFAARDSFRGGNRSPQELTSLVERELTQCGVTNVDYIALVDEKNLEPVQVANETCRLLIAAHVGSVRLIDNVQLA